MRAQLYIIPSFFTQFTARMIGRLYRLVEPFQQLRDRGIWNVPSLFLYLENPYRTKNNDRLSSNGTT
jgi:hypothetical protein